MGEFIQIGDIKEEQWTEHFSKLHEDGERKKHIPRKKLKLKTVK